MKVQDNHQLVIKILKDIASELMNKDNWTSLYSLEMGSAGNAIFLGYMGKVLKEEQYTHASVELIEHTIEQVSENPHNQFSLFAGVTGVAWAIRHLCNIDVLSQEDLDVLEDIDPYITKSLSSLETQGMNSLMYGVVGHGVYFLEKLHNGDQHALQELHSIVDILERMAHQDEQGIYWRNETPEDGIDVLANIGLAHGIPSIISFLAKVYKLNIQPVKVKSMLEASIQWLLHKERVDSHTSLYPSFIYIPEDPKANSRLAWCYGDLSVAISLLHAFDALGERRYYEEATKLSIFSTQRGIEKARVKFDKTSGLIDTMFCHGTSGVSYLFQQVNRQINQSSVQDTAKNWMYQTLTNKHLGQGNLNDFYTYDNPSKKWEKQTGILQGITGVGLVLLSWISKEPLYWDRIFLTDVPQHKSKVK